MHNKSVAQLIKGLRERQFSSVEVTRTYLDRIAALDCHYNSFISVDAEQALAAAAAADKSLAAGNGTALTGIPIAHKDIFCTDGMRTSCGSRMLANFEGVMTTLEDRVAAAHVFTDPATVPEPHLDWLGGWIGVAFDPVLPAARRRDWLADAPRLARWHGTRRGLALALDVATGGGVRGGSGERRRPTAPAGLNPTSSRRLR